MSIRNIPSEYLIFRREDDFGFSAVDETELTPSVNPDTLETTVIRENMTASTEMILRMESKVDQILRLYNDGKLGLDAERIKLLEDTTAKLSEVEQIIMPLLVNLMKNPEKEYIYWPSRTDKIQEQIDRILSITRGISTE
jgi:hypothetical protein